MLRLLTLATFLCVSAIAIAQKSENPSGLLQWKIPDSERKAEEKKVRAPVLIDTAHIPANTGSLMLTTGELKLYSGHALNLLKSKCPNVNQHTLFKLHKFIGKQITKTEPIQGDNPKLKTLLDAMMECSSKAVASSLNEDLKNKMVGADDVKAARKGPTGIVVVAEFKTKVQSTASPATAVGAKPVEKKKWAEMNAEEKTKEITDLFKHFEPQRKPIEGDEGGPHHIMDLPPPPPPPTTTEKPKRNPIVGWLSSVMETVSSFFRGLFGFGSRGRRSTDFMEFEDSQMESDSPYLLTVWKPSEDKSAEVKPIPGRQAFLTLFDEICRIYCDTCQGETQTKDFKIAAREILQYLFAEGGSGLNLAAEHYLNHEFLQSLSEC